MKNKTPHLIIGPVLFAMCCVFLPGNIFNTLSSKAALGTVVWLAYWWVTRPLDLAVTAFLPIIINAFVNMAPMTSVISNYFSETIVLLLGSSILSAAMELTGLDKRIAAKFLGIIGENLRLQLVFWFLLSATLSAVLPNAVVCATITPIAVSMLKYAGEGSIRESKSGSKLLLYIAYGVGVGGLFSPLGGAMNLVTVDYLQKVTGKEFMYYSWIAKFLPVIFVLIISNLMFMLRNVKKDDALCGSKQYFQCEYKKMGKMSKEEKMSLVLFLTATILAFTRPMYQNYLPYLKPAYVFLTCAIISFLITNSEGQRIIKWKNVQNKIVWELIFVFAGGLAAGVLINQSGAADAIGNIVMISGLNGGFFSVLIIISITLVLSDVTSNTATASIVIPIVISVFEALKINPVPWIYIATIGVNLSYCLPTSIRAIPVGYGLDPKYMLKEGLKISAVEIVLMGTLAFLLLKFWPYFSI